LRRLFYAVWTVVGLVVLAAASVCGLFIYRLGQVLAPETTAAPLSPGATAKSNGLTVTIHDIRDPMPEAWAMAGERVVGFDIGITTETDSGELSVSCFDFTLVDDRGNEARPTIFLPEGEGWRAPRPQELRAELWAGGAARGWCFFVVSSAASLRALRFEPLLAGVAIEFRAGEAR